jgi:hypothetical protein
MESRVDATSATRFVQESLGNPEHSAAAPAGREEDAVLDMRLLQRTIMTPLLEQASSPGRQPWSLRLAPWPSRS